MIKLVKTSYFTKSAKRLLNDNPQLALKLRATLEILEINPFNPTLKTHKLKGKLKGLYACSVERDLRIIFDINTNKQDDSIDVILLNIGTHDDVYWDN